MLARFHIDDALRGKLDASDVVQQTLLQGHTSMAEFRGTSDRELSAWLRQILARVLGGELRRFHRLKRNVRLEAPLQAALNESTARLERWLADQAATPSECAIANERLMALGAALMELPEDQGRAVELHYLQGCPSAIVAARMGRTEIAVAGLLRRGIIRLRDLLHEDDAR
jgi:RNA polymerase sigma-70 factor (ECF subfamily)